MSQKQPERDIVAKGNRAASIIGMLLVAIGIVILSLVEVAFPEAGFATQMWFIILATLVIASGYILWFKYGRSQTEPRRRATNILIKLILAFVVLLVSSILIIIYVVAELPMEQRAFPFWFSIGLMTIGPIIAAVFGARAMMATRRVPPAVIDSFSQIHPDMTFETKKFTVFKKDDISILLPSTFGGAYFVRLFSQSLAQRETKARLPRLFPRSAYKDEIFGLSVAKRRGDFTIPSDIVRRGDRSEEKYVSGSGILYFVSIYDVRHSSGRRFPTDISSRLDKTAIMEIMEELSRETRLTSGTS